MDPLTPAECDLQDFAFMPLHVARLRDSDLAAEESAEACWYAVLLWSASWHQLPAASLPDNDTVLMRFCGLGKDRKTWERHKAAALRGFVKCSDGRLYHPVVAEQANEAWKKKLEQRWRTECARIKKHNQRNGTDVSPPTLEDFIRDKCIPVPLLSPGTRSECPPGKALQGTGTGTGTVITEANASAASAAAAPPGDPAKSLFDQGVALLTGKGTPERQARSVLAAFQRDFGNGPVLDAIERSRGATDPLSAMRSRLGKAKAQAEYLGV